MFCPNCGFENDDSNKFCLSCGRSIAEESEEFSRQKNNSTGGYRTSTVSSNPISNSYNSNSRSDYNLFRDIENGASNAHYETTDSYSRNHTKPTQQIISMIFSIGGAVLAVIGCFLPFIGFLGVNMSLIGSSRGGNEPLIMVIIIILCMIISAILSFKGYAKATFFALAPAYGIVAYISYFYLGSEITKSGFYSILFGCISTAVGGLIALSGNWDKTSKGVGTAAIITAVASVILGLIIALNYQEKLNGFLNFNTDSKSARSYSMSEEAEIEMDLDEVSDIIKLESHYRN